MSIQKSKHLYYSHYKLDNDILEKNEENPYLEVQIYQNLKLASHISKFYNEANSIFLGLIKCCLIHANHDLKELAYISL